MKRFLPVVLIIIAGIAVAYFMIKDNKPKLKVYNPIDINPAPALTINVKNIR